MTHCVNRAGLALRLTTGAALALMAGQAAWAADSAGVLDATFGAGAEDGTPAGVVATSLGNGDDVAADLAVGADGSVLVVGNRAADTGNDVVLVRYTADGSFDASFGVGSEDGTPDGVVDISLGAGHDFATATAVQADGKVLVAGYHEEGGSTNIILARLNADGSADDSFGQGEDGTPNGFVATSLGKGDDKANAVALQADGKIVIAGSHVAEDGSSNMLVARYDATGVADATFGTAEDGSPDGFVNISLGDGNDTAHGVALQADGKIAVVGDSVSADGSSNFVLARLTADGAPDDAFGVGDDGTPNGFVQTSLGEGNDFATGLAVQADGKLVVVGYHQEGTSTNIAVARYNADGALDQTFGTADDGTENGVVNLSLGDGDDTANAVALQGDKLVVVAGTTTATDGSKNIAVLRLTAQ